MTEPIRDQYIADWKIRVLDSKSPSFCGAKFYNASMWLNAGWTTSCFHNPVHQIDIEEIKKNTRRFAKRQLTWFKRNENTKWFDYLMDRQKIIEFIKLKT